MMGERSLVTGQPSITSVVVSQDHTFALLLSRDDFVAVLPNRMRSRLQKTTYVSQVNARGYQLSDFDVKAMLGTGAFAQVALVAHKASGELYALKKMNRDHIMSENVTRQVVNERFVLGGFDHPCIAKLMATFKTRHSLFMLLEPCDGGELFARMKKARRLDERAAGFYASCVVLALGHMHSRSVIYRDLKPENIMILGNGYAQIVDFGFAKRVYGGRTFTLCGTPEYLAPELLLTKGHGKGVDWWALGVLLYEMMVGVTPFCFDPQTRRPNTDLPPTELYKNILNPQYELSFPSRLTQDACDVIEDFLSYDPLSRLGELTGGEADVQQHPFFVTWTNWTRILSRQSEPPWLPQLSSGDGTSNFEQTTIPADFLSEPPYDFPSTEWDADF